MEEIRPQGEANERALETRSSRFFGNPEAIPGRAPVRRIAVPAVLLLAALASVSCTIPLPGAKLRPGPPEDSIVFYPELPETPRIQYLATYTSEEDVVGPRTGFARFILGERKNVPELAKPYGVAIHEGKIFVCDARRAVVVIFDLVAHTTALLGDQARGHLRKPINVIVDADGIRYVADTGLRRVMVYDSANHYVRALGDPQRWEPSDLVLFESRLYVVDLQNGQVVVLDKETGEELQRFARKGSGEGEVLFPTNLEVDGDGNVYVSDTGTGRVLEFAPDGAFRRQFGSLGRAPGQLVRPKGIAVDHEGRLYVVDAAFENVQIFGPDGKLLLFFGSAGNVPGGLNLPAKVEIDYDHVDLFSNRVAPGYGLEYLILVTSQFGRNKVNVYGFLAPGKREVHR